MTSFGIAIPQTVEQGRFDGPAVQAHLRRAEELGFAERVDPGADHR